MCGFFVACESFNLHLCAVPWPVFSNRAIRKCVCFYANWKTSVHPHFLTLSLWLTTILFLCSTTSLICWQINQTDWDVPPGVSFQQLFQPVSCSCPDFFLRHVAAIKFKLSSRFSWKGQMSHFQHLICFSVVIRMKSALMKFENDCILFYLHAT